MQNEFKPEGRLDGPMASVCIRSMAGTCTRPAARTTRLLVGIVALCLSAAAAAVEMDTLYSVQVPLDPQDPDSRNTAYQTALIEVLVRVTGTTAIVESEQIAELFPNPAGFVLQYRLRPDNTLVVSLDGPAIEKVLRGAGASVWGSERPLTLIWIAVDRGQGEREIVAADDPQRMSGDARSIDRNRLLRERVTELARRRGIPVLFPLLDIEDLENVSFSDIWGGFDDLLLLASERYQAETVLVGRIRSESPNMNRWTWYLGEERTNWTGGTEEVINLLADSLAIRFKVDSRSPLETIRLTISGVDSVKAFGRVQRYMENLRGVDEISIDSVSGDRINYEVKIQGGIERLQRTLESGTMLEPIDPFGEGVEVVPFSEDGDPFESYDDRGRQQTSLQFLYRSD